MRISSTVWADERLVHSFATPWSYPRWTYFGFVVLCPALPLRILAQLHQDLSQTRLLLCVHDGLWLFKSRLSSWLVVGSVTKKRSYFHHQYRCFRQTQTAPGIIRAYSNTVDGQANDFGGLLWLYYLSRCHAKELNLEFLITSFHQTSNRQFSAPLHKSGLLVFSAAPFAFEEWMPS